MLRVRAAAICSAEVSQQMRAMRIIERPRMLRTSTRRMSVQGTHLVTEGVFLETEEQAEMRKFPAAADDSLFEDCVAGNSLFAETFRDERHGDASEEKEEGRGECAAEL